MAGVGLSVSSGKDWSKTIPNARKFLDDPMLDGSAGGLALFDYAHSGSWPSQDAPDALNQKWLNLIQSTPFPHLFLGDSAAVEASDPGFSGGFVFNATQVDRMTAPSAAALNFTNENWFISAWVMLPTAFFTAGGFQTVFSKRQGDGSYGLFLGTNSINSSVFTGTGTTEVASATYTPSPALAAGTLYQIVQAVRFSGGVLFNEIYLNGVMVASASASAASIATVTYSFKLGAFFNNILPANLTFLRLYAENTTLSGNNQASRIAYEWNEVKGRII
jgi:Concanavalin A-like lectin/glucanases superfamily